MLRSRTRLEFTQCRNQKLATSCCEKLADISPPRAGARWKASLFSPRMSTRRRSIPISRSLAVSSRHGGMKSGS